MKILIAEDDPNILDGLAQICEAEGYETLRARNGKEALALFQSQSPDFVCLDIMMPGMSGYDVCREIRKASRTVPVVFISAKSEEIDKVLGLELGADDYLVKPFGVREVAARIRAVTRRCLAARTPESNDEPFRMADVEIFPAELRARRDAADDAIDLSLRDIQILRILYENRGKAVSRHQLFQGAWGIDHIPNSRTLDQHISQLRKRIECDPKEPTVIRTVHGVGYRFEG
ncbi:response regulator transcription factor [Candidatus Sumerlaeota bacterium]|nr:response regulator transcription factor [Candidatus Sumerlaeota bacterium]